jgi:hypothetical protein
MDVVKNSAKLPRRWQRDKSVLKSCTGATTPESVLRKINAVNAIYSANCHCCSYCTKLTNYCLDTVIIPFPDTFFQIVVRIL